jgi:hypothetical protein
MTVIWRRMRVGMRRARVVPTPWARGTAGKERLEIKGRFSRALHSVVELGIPSPHNVTDTSEEEDNGSDDGSAPGIQPDIASESYFPKQGSVQPGLRTYHTRAGTSTTSSSDAKLPALSELKKEIEWWQELQSAKDEENAGLSRKYSSKCQAWPSSDIVFYQKHWPELSAVRGFCKGATWSSREFRRLHADSETTFPREVSPANPTDEVRRRITQRCPKWSG